MSLSPLLDPLHIGLVAEVVFVPWFFKPAPLAIRFAGPATIGGHAEQLPAGVMNVGCEENFAASAFVAVALGTHRPKSGKKKQTANQ
jgi:hypothetical protein